MDASAPSDGPDFLEKQYPYRYAWSSVLTLLLGGAFIVILFGGVTLVDAGVLSILGTIGGGIIILGGVWLAVVNRWARLKLRVTREGIHVPSIWKWSASTLIPFEGLTHVMLLRRQGNMLLRFRLGDRNHLLAGWWLAPRDFDQLVEIVRQRLPQAFVDQQKDAEDPLNKG